jgi:hypothetical protein
MVRVALATEGGDEASALMPDAEFYAHPVQPGDTANLIWSYQDVHMLANT